jgi:DNA-binding IclR family transcriptional regulator
MSDWTFLTNHAHVLLLLSRDPDLRMRDLAEAVGITERAVHRIVHELTESGYLEVEKMGRRNHYRVRATRPMRHPVERGACVADLLHLIDDVKTAAG